jgi:ParB family transcriptional regulator, chromosome partitioning protein
VAERGMGRGLAALLASPQLGGGEHDVDLRHVPLELIKPNPRQPRRDFDEGALERLAHSIEARGVLQPIVVRPLAGGSYELVAGERRLRAANSAGLGSVPAVIRDADERDQLDLALTENMARVDLNAVEQARACAMLVEDLGLTKEEVGRRVGRSRVAISNLIRLLDLPDEVLDLIEARELSEGHGRAVLLCKDHATRRRLALDARDGAWSVRETEDRARDAERGPAPPRPGRETPSPLHPDLEEALSVAEDALSAALGREVRVRASGEGCRAEMDFAAPADAVVLAEQILAGPARRAA